MARGSGVYNSSNGFAPKGGKITANTATENGGRTYSSGSLSIEDGRISDNLAGQSGDGMFVSAYSTQWSPWPRIVWLCPTRRSPSSVTFLECGGSRIGR